MPYEAFSVEAVIQEELKQIAERRYSISTDEQNPHVQPQATPWASDNKSVYDTALESDLCGLAISGGGIRSATFGLGIVQGLAVKGLLPRFDYLSCVSGGGYIGAWLAKWIQRAGLKEVLQGLEPPQYLDDSQFTAYQRQALSTAQAPAPQSATAQQVSDSQIPEGKWKELREIRHLRFYSNYLSPRLGIFSADGWVLIAIYLRNLLLNQLVLLLALMSLFLAMRFLVEQFAVMHGASKAMFLFLPSSLSNTAITPIWGAAPCAILSLTVALTYTVWLALRNPGQGWWTRLLSLAWLLAAIASAMLFVTPDIKNFLADRDLGGYFALAVGAMHAMLAVPVSLVHARQRKWKAVIGALMSGVVAGGIGGFLLYRALSALVAFGSRGDYTVPLFVVVGPPLFLTTYVLTNFLQIGLARAVYETYEREWWSALNASLLRISAAWIVFATIAVLGPWLIGLLLNINDGTITAMSAAAVWVASTATGLLAARSPSTGKNKRTWVDLVARIAPGIFLLGLLLLVSFFVTWFSYATHRQFTKEGSCAEVQQADQDLFLAALFGSDRQQFLKDMNEPTELFCLTRWLPYDFMKDWQFSGAFTLVIAVLVCIGLWLLLGSLIGVNTFSLHDLYAVRLVRCYLGATNENRKPDGFTNLDPGDDMPLADLRSSVAEKGAPILILNGALNRKGEEVVAGREEESLAFQDRQAESFVFTPFHCGSESTRYCRTKDFASSIQLGGAMAVSGAAVSPNMGYHSSPAVTALLTVFNMRLGAWFGNPSKTLGDATTTFVAWLSRRNHKWGDWVKEQLTKPRFSQNNPSAAYFLFELLGMTDSKSSYVYLSDGGHFENMGVYELIRRRCRFIVAIDSGADPLFLQENLGNLVRKVRIDLGVRIEIDVAETRPCDGFCKTHIAVGKIHYGDVHGEPTKAQPGNPMFQYEANQGLLIYLKVGLTGDEPIDLLNFQAENPLFPYDPTLDQFFSEAQFESYRAVGVHTALQLMETGAVASEQAPTDSNCEVFKRLYERWMPRAPGLTTSYLECNVGYAEIQEKLRNDARLKHFAQELCGNGTDKRIATHHRRRPSEALAERLMLVQMMSLLENTYFSLALEHKVHHPDNAGWLAVVENWTRTSVYKAHWPHVKSEFSKTFRMFLDRIEAEYDGKSHNAHD